MVFPLHPTAPAKFYGSSLPRPRFYVKPDGADRIDPPVSVIDPFMSWAEEAHWSMGGLNVKRLRLQGKIEGNVQKLRSQRKKQAKAQTHSPMADLPRSKKKAAASASPSPPPAPVASKRRRLMALLQDVEDLENEQEVKVVVAMTPDSRRKRLVKKLGDDFDRVASPENEGSDEMDSDTTTLRRTKRRLVKIGDAVKKVAEEGEKLNSKSKSDDGEKSPVSGNRVRTSPRLAKRGY